MNQQLWTDKDLLKYSIIAWLIGVLVGIGIGFEWAWKPVIDTFIPLKG